jgi:hypothetical protein
LAGARRLIGTATMTDPEDFLSRWSRRKRHARTEVEDESAPADLPKQDQAGVTASVAHGAAAPQQARGDSDDAKPENVFDLSKLPSLDSIGPATDIRMFMQPGVPEALSRAALRRAWSADPGIRDFIGLAENSWDFTASDGMHGFGALDPADAKRLLAQLFAEHDSKDDKLAERDPQESSSDDTVSTADARQDETAAPELSSNTDDETVSGAVGPDTDADKLKGDVDTAADVAPQHAAASVASQQKPAGPSREPAFVPRNHGRALPQ